MPAADAEQLYHWSWDLKASPEALWPLVSDTDRFNRDCGYPTVSVVPPAEAPPASRVTNARRLRARVLGFTVEWDEYPFEWIAPRRFGVERIFHRGPVARLVLTCELEPLPAPGTRLTYAIRVTPADWRGRLLIPYSIGRRARTATERIFRRYDELARRGDRVSRGPVKPRLADGGAARLESIASALVREAGYAPALVARLQTFIATADDLSAARIRAYLLADEWGEPRRTTLQLFLHATRAGLLDFSWDLVCPHCRGARPGRTSLKRVSAEAYCDSCNLDFTVHFDRSVELTFTPSPAIRPVVRADYCVGGPQLTPHIVAQQRLGPGAEQRMPLALVAGRYRVRSPGGAEQTPFRVDCEGQGTLVITVGAEGGTEPSVAPRGELVVRNGTDRSRLVLVEHLAWTDQATTAAEVTSLQLFRDLFSSEVLRPGEQISVGSLTVVFTDLKNSTQLYRDIGDAPAFGRVLTHFELLKAAVAAEDGGIVKTMGDAIMAVFPRPLAAVRAIVHAQRWLADPTRHPLPAGVTFPPSSLQPLALKAGVHCGPCLAINQNDRLDYFGTTVNITARLCTLCTGTDLVLSNAVRRDREVTDFLDAPDSGLNATDERTLLKGFGAAAFEICRLRPREAGPQ